MCVYLHRTLKLNKMKNIEVSIQQAEFILDKAYKSPTSDIKYVIYIGDGNDDAYTLNIPEILETICMEWYNEKNRSKYVLHKEWIETMQEVFDGYLENLKLLKHE